MWDIKWDLLGPTWASMWGLGDVGQPHEPLEYEPLNFNPYLKILIFRKKGATYKKEPIPHLQTHSNC